MDQDRKKAHRNKNCSIDDSQGRPESWVHTLGGLRRLAVDPRQDPASLHLWTSSGGCRDRLSSGHTPYVRVVHDQNRSVGEQVVLMQQSKALVF